MGILNSKSYSFPVITIGNLNVGGTGKTPHTEFVVKLLRENHRLATLSRGYGRKTKGFKIADSADNAKTVGDEPFQLFNKFDDVIVAVDEKRVRGIEKLRKLPSPPNIIVLDDAFQHRYVKAGLNILLTDYSNLYINDLPLPSGRLREPKRAAKRADIIVVTKSPSVLSPLEIRRITSTLKPLDYQKVFFSFIAYEKLKPLNQVAKELQLKRSHLKTYSVTLVTAIANPKPLELYLKRYTKDIDTINFKDHHQFQDKDYTRMIESTSKSLSPNKAIILTEKDAVKFDVSKLGSIPVFSIPIIIKFHELQKESFSEEIKEHVRSYTTNH